MRTFSGPIADSRDRRSVPSSEGRVMRASHERPGLTSPFRTRCDGGTNQRLCRPPPSTVAVPINQDRLRKMADHGLTEYQARVYLTLLDLGSATASQISPLSKVPRTRIYAAMQQLHEKGLVQILPETPCRQRPRPTGRGARDIAAPPGRPREPAQQAQRPRSGEGARERAGVTAGGTTEGGGKILATAREGRSSVGGRAVSIAGMV